MLDGMKVAAIAIALLGPTMANAIWRPGSAVAFVSPDGAVRLVRPSHVMPRHDFPGRALMTGGWRLMWDGRAVGRGAGVVRFAIDARPGDGRPGTVTELLQIGSSADPAVVRACLRAGLHGGNTRRLPARVIRGHRWAAVANSDAGMSQSIMATDLRTVAGGRCYAIERVSYRVTADDGPGRGAPTQAQAAAAIDGILASVRVGRAR